MDLLVATKPQFLSGLLAGAVGLLVKLLLGGKLPLIPYLFVGVGAVLGIYAWILLIVMNQKHVYLDLLSRLLPPKYQEIFWGRRKSALDGDAVRTPLSEVGP